MAARMGYLFRVSPIHFLELQPADWLMAVAAYQVVQADRKEEADQMKKSSRTSKRK